MKYPYLLSLLLILLFVSCNKRYLFLRKVSVDAQVQKETFVKHKTPIIEEYIAAPIIDTMSVQGRNEIPVQDYSSSGKQHYLKSGDKELPKLLRKNKKMLEPVSPPDEDPEETWNSSAVAAFWLGTVIVLTVPMIFVFPIIIVLSLILSMLCVKHGRKAYKEIKTVPEKGKGLAIAMIIFGALVGAFILSLLFGAYVYVLTMSEVAGYVALAVVTALIFWIVAWSSFKDTPTKDQQKSMSLNSRHRP